MTAELPPLPQPWPRKHKISCAVYDPSPGHCDCGSLPKVYDADDMRRYGEACRRNAGVTAAPAPVSVEQILSCADQYGDARIMASRGRVDRSEVDEARKELRELVERALGVLGTFNDQPKDTK